LALASVSGALSLLNLATYWRLGRSWRVTGAELFGHIAADIGALTALLCFSGGTTSPFIGLPLVFVAIAGASLRWAYCLGVLLLTIACYALLDLFNLPLSPSPIGTQGFQAASFSLCMNYAVGATLVAYFVGALAALLREQSRT